MRPLIAIAIVTASIAGCGGAAKPNPVAGCKGLPTARQSDSGLGFSDVGADQRYVCVHLGRPAKIVRDIGLVSWVYSNAIVRFGSGRVVSTDTTADPNGIKTMTQRDPVVSAAG